MPTTSENSEITVSQYLVQFFEQLGILYSFGVSGGAIVPIWEDLTKSSIRVVHCRHEVGAVYSAVEVYFASGEPALVFTTTGPGITNALTGIALAKVERAKMIFVAAMTPNSKSGFRPLQESNVLDLEFLAPGCSLVGTDYVGVVQTAADLPGIAHHITCGLKGNTGFIGTILIASDVMSLLTSSKPLSASIKHRLPVSAPQDVADLARQLQGQEVLLWIGNGYRGISKPLLAVAEKLNAAVMTSPEAKGIFPERHELALGVSGIGCDSRKIASYLHDSDPRWVIIIGTHLEEMTSEWRNDRIAGRKIVYINLNIGMCNAWLHSVSVDIWNVDASDFLFALDRALLEKAPKKNYTQVPRIERLQTSSTNLVSPSDVMAAIQELVVDSTDAIVMADSGNAMAWAASCLRFNSPERFRGSYKFAPMGQFACGIVGAGILGKIVVAVVGDGAMLMNNEISTAVGLGIDAKWVVLNDSSYNMCRQGLRLMGRTELDTRIPEVRFDQYARALGAKAERVENPAQLDDALRLAVSTPGPFVVDVVVDPEEFAPIEGRLNVLGEFLE